MPPKLDNFLVYLSYKAPRPKTMPLVNTSLSESLRARSQVTVDTKSLGHTHIIHTSQCLVVHLPCSSPGATLLASCPTQGHPVWPCVTWNGPSLGEL